MAPRLAPEAVAGAAAWSIAGGLIQQVVSFGLFVVLARLLTPTEFGIMALAAGAMDVLLVLSRAGIPELLLQDARTDQRRLSTAAWVSLACGITAALTLLAAAPLLAAAYGIDDLTDLCRLLAVVCVIQAASTVHETMIRKALDYRRLTLRLGIATLIGGILAVGLALTGAGIYALIAQRLFIALSLTLLAWQAYPWRPQLTIDLGEVRRLLTEGPRLSLGYTLGYLNPRLLETLVALHLGPAAIGLYRVASRSIDMVGAVLVTPLSSLCLPLLGRLRDDPRLHDTLGHLLAAMVYLAAPAVLGIMLFGAPLTRLVFGEPWAEAGLVLAILAPTLLCTGLTGLTEGTLGAFNRAGRIATLNTLQLAATAVLTLGTVGFGAPGVAAGQGVRSVLMVALGAHLVRDVVPIGTILVRIAWVPLACGLLAEGAAALLARTLFGPEAVMPALMAAGLAYLAAVASISSLGYGNIFNIAKILARYKQ